MTDDIQLKIEHFAKEMLEHVDAVRIFVSYPGPNNVTKSFNTGLGNYYAQYGQIREWLITQDAITAHEGPREDHDDERA